MSTLGEKGAGPGGGLSRVVVGFTGASGAAYGVRLLQALRELGMETHLVISEWGREVLSRETGMAVEEVHALACRAWEPGDLRAPLSSGSFLTRGMVVVPCSMRTLAAIAHGCSHNLIARAADVTLKEGRKLILVPRETPLSTVHLENMLSLARAGACLLPAMPAFYPQPRTIADLVDHLVARILDHLGLEHSLGYRWGD